MTVQPLTTIYFVRHAKVSYIPDEQLRPLSEEGMRQAEAMKTLFSNIAIDHVISSPYQRAIDTISGVAAMNGLPIKTKNNLRERQITDGPIKDFESFTERQWQDRDYKLQNGESLNEVQKRATQAVEDILKSHQDKTIMIGTHGTFLSAILNYYDSTFGYEQWQKMRMPAVYKMVFSNTTFISYEAVTI